MTDGEKLHLRAAAYANKAQKDIAAYRKATNQPEQPFDWVLAYDSYVAGWRDGDTNGKE